MAEFFVGSEIGKLRKVIVHRPDLELRRLTPTNHDDLLFDDVLWVRKAREQHDVFVDLMRDRGAEVYHLTDLLGETLESQKVRELMVDRVVTEYTVGAGAVDDVRRALSEMKPTDLADHLVGGLTGADLQRCGVDIKALGRHSLLASASDPESFVLIPLPNTMFTRDSSCWIYNGVSLNPMYWPARQLEVFNVGVIYKFHPMFKDADFEFWYPPTDLHGKFVVQDFGRASLEGGDVMPIGNKTVFGWHERTINGPHDRTDRHGVV